MNIACAIMEAGGGECQGERKGFFQKEGMRSVVTLREERSRVRRGSSGRDHHLPSLTLPRELSFLTGQSF